MKKNLLYTLIYLVVTTVPALAARDKIFEEHINNELAFYKNINSCTPIESSEANFNTSRKIYGQEENGCHFVYRTNIDCHVPMEVAKKFSEAGIRLYNDFSDYGMITSTTADLKYLDKEVLYNNRYCRFK